jgi:hypothetical protein
MDHSDQDAVELVTNRLDRANACCGVCTAMDGREYQKRVAWCGALPTLG